MTEDFKKQAWVYIVDGYKRNWKTLWLVREPKLRRVFIGHVNVIRRDYQGCIIELVDDKWRLQQKPYIEAKEEEYKNAKLAWPSRFELFEV